MLDQDHGLVHVVYLQTAHYIGVGLIVGPQLLGDFLAVAIELDGLDYRLVTVVVEIVHVLFVEQVKVLECILLGFKLAPLGVLVQVCIHHEDNGGTDQIIWLFVLIREEKGSYDEASAVSVFRDVVCAEVVSILVRHFVREVELNGVQLSVECWVAAGLKNGNVLRARLIQIVVVHDGDDLLPSLIVDR